MQPCQSALRVSAHTQRLRPVCSLAQPANSRVGQLSSRLTGASSRRLACRAEPEKASTTEVEPDATPSSQGPPKQELLSEEELRKLGELRRQQQQQRDVTGSTNILQGALEEAQLISWPRPQKAFLDTILVLGIVMGSGGLLLGVNVLLANLSEFWYHRG